MPSETMPLYRAQKISTDLGHELGDVWTRVSFTDGPMDRQYTYCRYCFAVAIVDPPDKFKGNALTKLCNGGKNPPKTRKKQNATGAVR